MDSQAVGPEAIFRRPVSETYPLQRKLGKWEKLTDMEKLNDKLKCVINVFFESDPNNFEKDCPDLCIRFSQLMHRVHLAEIYLSGYEQIRLRFAKAGIFNNIKTDPDLVLKAKDGEIPVHQIVLGFRSTRISYDKPAKRENLEEEEEYTWNPSQHSVSVLQAYKSYIYTADVSPLLSPTDLVELYRFARELYEDHLWSLCIIRLKEKAKEISTLQGLKEFSQTLSRFSGSELQKLQTLALEAFYRNNSVTFVASSTTPGSYLLGVKHLYLLQEAGEIGDLTRKYVCGIFIEEKAEDYEMLTQARFFKKETRAKIHEISLPKTYIWNITHDIFKELKWVVLRMQDAWNLFPSSAHNHFLIKQNFKECNFANIVLKFGTPPSYDACTLEEKLIDFKNWNTMPCFHIDAGDTFEISDDSSFDYFLRRWKEKEYEQFKLYDMFPGRKKIIFKKKRAELKSS